MLWRFVANQRVKSDSAPEYWESSEAFHAEPKFGRPFGRCFDTQPTGKSGTHRSPNQH